MAAAASSSSTLGGAIRDTDEYAAAFDLEVWKAQQQARYQAELRQAKENLERRLRTQLRDTEQRKLAELEALRQDLETMGKRLQLAEEALARRSAQLDAREAAFQARRVKVAEQHEAYVTRAEERERRTREESQLTQSSLQARVQEKDQMIAQLQERLSAAQNEYELLRRRAARYLTEQTDTDGQRLREQECALALAHTQLTEAQRLLRNKTADAERLAEDKAHMQSQLREATQQLAILTRKYNRLSEESQTREWEHIRKEQDALDAAKRVRALHANRGRGYTDPVRMPPANPLTPFMPASTSQSAHVAAPTDAVARVEGRDAFYSMIADLKQEVKAGLTAKAKGACSSASISGGTPRSLPYKIVERTPSGAPQSSFAVANAACSGQRREGVAPSSKASRMSPTDANVNREAAERVPCSEGEMSKDEASTMSAAVSAIQGVQPFPTPASSPPPQNTSARLNRSGDVVVDMGDTSIDSYYPRAELQSWPQSLLAERDDDDAHAVAPLPPARAGTLPPLAPELRGVYDNGEDVSSQGLRVTSLPPVSPTPEDFVLAREAPMTETSRTQAARREMTNFVQQLKVNREKLLETGVYAEHDGVVREMGEKIRMYEEYLAQHP